MKSIFSIIIVSIVFIATNPSFAQTPKLDRLNKLMEIELMRGKHADLKRLEYLYDEAKKEGAILDKKREKQRQESIRIWHEKNKKWFSAKMDLVERFKPKTVIVDVITAGPASKGILLKRPMLIYPRTLTNEKIIDSVHFTEDRFDPSTKGLHGKVFPIFGIIPIDPKLMCRSSAFMPWYQDKEQEIPCWKAVDNVVKQIYGRWKNPVKNIGSMTDYKVKIPEFCGERIDGTVTCLNKGGNDVVPLFVRIGVLKLNEAGRAVYGEHEEYAKASKLGLWDDNAIVK